MATKKTQGRAIAGLFIFGGVAALVYFGGTAIAKAAGDDEDEDEDPEVDPDPQVAGGGGGSSQPKRKKVPGKTGTGRWNLALFPSTESVQQALTALSPFYLDAIDPRTFDSAVRRFQEHWNELSLTPDPVLESAGLLVPARLNGTTLKVDGDAGPQTLRALEWAIGMQWSQRLAAAGLQL